METVTISIEMFVELVQAKQKLEDIQKIILDGGYNAESYAKMLFDVVVPCDEEDK